MSFVKDISEEDLFKPVVCDDCGNVFKIALNGFIEGGIQFVCPKCSEEEMNLDE